MNAAAVPLPQAAPDLGTPWPMRLISRERRIGTEASVTITTPVAMFGGELVAGAVSMVTIPIEEFIAKLDAARARASVEALIGSVPKFALECSAGGESTVAIGPLKVGDLALVRPGEKVPRWPQDRW